MCTVFSLLMPCHERVPVNLCIGGVLLIVILVTFVSKVCLHLVGKSAFLEISRSQYRREYALFHALDFVSGSFPLNVHALLINHHTTSHSRISRAFGYDAGLGLPCGTASCSERVGS